MANLKQNNKDVENCSDEELQLPRYFELVNRCPVCNKIYDCYFRKKEELICGHTACSVCKECGDVCRQCLSLFEEEAYDDFGQFDEDKENNNWLFEDITDATDEYNNESFSHSKIVQYTMSNVFNLTEFRPKQLAAINAVVLRDDCFVMFPSGGGKSLVYQLPAYISARITFVISPLRSLIFDQVILF